MRDNGLTKQIFHAHFQARFHIVSTSGSVNSTVHGSFLIPISDKRPLVRLPIHLNASASLVFELPFDLPRYDSI